ncbi:MAG TPA: hypothetical protein PLA68_10885, partial [Panacibacter sp.]|nr:hypothetical protein [Panacibacter sp.]
PEAFPYQAVVRNSSGNLIANQNVSLRFSIRSLSSGTDVVLYQETQSVTTNGLGLFSVNVGEGNVVSGTFENIPWDSASTHLQVEIDVTGGTNYVDMGSPKLNSVPYSLYAKKALNAQTAANGLPVGTAAGQMLYWNGIAWVSILPGSNHQTLSFCSGVPTWGPCPALMATTTVTAITGSTASCGGTITDPGSGSGVITERGVCWSTSHNPVITGDHLQSGSGMGSFVCNLTSLLSGTTYFIRAYAINENGTWYGNELSFTTTSVVTLPVLTTTALTKTETIAVYSGGNITNSGGSQVTSRGVCYSTSANPTIDDAKTSNGYDVGNFSSSFGSLTPNTTYYVRAYATNSAGTAYGNQLTFTTPYFSIGQNYAGGIVVYVDATGQHGMVVAPADQGSDIWVDFGVHIGTAIGDNLSFTFGSGPANTTTIVSRGQSQNAADMARNYNGGGYTDWFLPNSAEFDKIYERKEYVGGLGDAYWISDPQGGYPNYYASFYVVNNSYAYPAPGFIPGNTYYDYSWYQRRVRAARFF